MHVNRQFIDYLQANGVDLEHDPNIIKFQEEFKQLWDQQAKRISLKAVNVEKVDKIAKIVINKILDSELWKEKYNNFPVSFSNEFESVIEEKKSSSDVVMPEPTQEEQKQSSGFSKKLKSIIDKPPEKWQENANQVFQEKLESILDKEGNRSINFRRLCDFYVDLFSFKKLVNGKLIRIYDPKAKDNPQLEKYHKAAKIIYEVRALRMLLRRNSDLSFSDRLKLRAELKEHLKSELNKIYYPTKSELKLDKVKINEILAASNINQSQLNEEVIRLKTEDRKKETACVINSNSELGYDYPGSHEFKAEPKRSIMSVIRATSFVRRTGSNINRSWSSSSDGLLRVASGDITGIGPIESIKEEVYEAKSPVEMLNARQFLTKVTAYLDDLNTKLGEKDFLKKLQ